MVKHRSDTRWLSDPEVGWRRVRSALCTWRRGAHVSWLSLKIKVDCFPVWTSKLVTLVWCFGPQNHYNGFLVWASKWSRLRFVGCTRKPTGGWFNAGHALRSGSLLQLEASRARISQSDLKTGGCAMTGDAHSIIVKVTLRWSWRWMSRFDGLRRTLLPQNHHF
jgi:hypothetical protein